jgi:hypothetical protein
VSYIILYHALVCCFFSYLIANSVIAKKASIISYVCHIFTVLCAVVLFTFYLIMGNLVLCDTITNSRIAKRRKLKFKSVGKTLKCRLDCHNILCGMSMNEKSFKFMLCTYSTVALFINKTIKKK